MKTNSSKRLLKRRVTGYRKPTYGAGLRLAQIVLELQSRPLGWSVDAIADELGIHPKTVRRYVKVLTQELTGKDGVPLVILDSKWGKSVLRFATYRSPGIDLTSSHIISLYLSTLLLGFIRGVPAFSSLEELLKASTEKLPAPERRKLTALGKKLYYVPDGPKDYSRHTERLNRIIESIFDQKKLRIVYRSPYGSGKEWEGAYAPYTLMMYKRGLYLVGLSEKHGEIRSLAVERLIRMDTTGESFDLPANYSPSSQTEGAFGIITGEPVDVSIRFDKRTEPLVTGRRWHPSQKIDKLPNGGVRLRMRVRGTKEILPLIMSFGPSATVEQPVELKRQVLDWVSQMYRSLR